MEKLYERIALGLHLVKFAYRKLLYAIWMYRRRDRLAEADLSYLDLSKTYLPRGNLARANLHKADLSGANLAHCDLRGADLSRALLFKTNLRGADLEGAIVTSDQLDMTRSLRGATMPDGTMHA
jgi:uncharacterized protein YjbI with pentapeptide repeats